MQGAGAGLRIAKPSAHEGGSTPPTADADGTVDQLGYDIEAILRGRARVVAKRISRPVQDHVTIAGRKPDRFGGRLGREPAGAGDHETEPRRLAFPEPDRPWRAGVEARVERFAHPHR